MNHIVVQKIMKCYFSATNLTERKTDHHKQSESPWLGMIAIMTDNEQCKLPPDLTECSINPHLSFRVHSCVKSSVWPWGWGGKEEGKVRACVVVLPESRSTHSDCILTAMRASQSFYPHNESTTNATCCYRDCLSVHATTTILTNKCSRPWWALTYIR